MQRIRPWETTRSEPLGDFRVFRLRRDWKISPRTNHELDFFVLECVNWVNVIALTTDHHLVMVEHYEGPRPRRIGQVFSNPAIMNNTTFTVLIEECRCEHQVQFDHGEDLITRLVPVQEVPKLIADGKIRHSLVVAALYWFELWQRAHPPR